MIPKFGSNDIPIDGRHFRQHDFANYYRMNMDDIFANARGIAAFQNCKQLHSAKIVNCVAKGVNGAIAEYYKDYYRKYMEKLNNGSRWYCELQKNPKYSSDYNDERAHWFGACLVDLAVSTNNWNALKTFFKGERPTDELKPEYLTVFGKYVHLPDYYNNIDLSLCKKTGFSESNFEHIDQENGLKLANTTYRLYRLYNPSFSAASAKQYAQFMEMFFSDSKFTGNNSVRLSSGSVFLKSFMLR